MIIWATVFKNGPSKVFQRLSSTKFTWYILEYFNPYDDNDDDDDDDHDVDNVLGCGIVNLLVPGVH